MTLTENNGLRRLSPAEGKHLRRVGQDAVAEGDVYLGRNDSQDNYEEVSEAEYQARANPKPEETAE